MQLTVEQQLFIRANFGSWRNIADLSTLLNYVHSCLPLENSSWMEERTKAGLDIHHITLFADPNSGIKKYTSFNIPKKNGGERIIHAPVPALKNIQRYLNTIFQVIFSSNFQEFSNGFTPGKSIIDNAKLHIRKPFVYNIDLKDFFFSISLGRIKAALMIPPFSFLDKSEHCATLLANLCCLTDALDPDISFLPQGAPTSPILTNVVCQLLDYQLTNLAHRFNATYSRYADDITFSSSENIYAENNLFIQDLSRIILAQGFMINPNKTRLINSMYRQEVTGLVVNQRLNVPRKFWRTIRLELFYWQKVGYTKANRSFKKKYQSRNLTNKKPDICLVIRGKLEFMRSVRGNDDKLYQKYWSIFEKLIAHKNNHEVISF